ncbi:ABC transporter substrate-binding protein [Pontiella desulfatans]|uniref:ABC transporter substrate-binding protein n=1 Tax=Pontiella desulfatans TaxID=2750659 RepID=UPI0014442803|nr:helical backbone metal receptor [Pontiella desulfatans]
MAPDITETVHALGLGDKLMGATTYCTYPDAAKTVPRVGGFGQFNFEAIVTLKPDLVILHEGYENEKSRLDGLGIRYLATKTRSVADITESIRKVGMACGAEAEVEKRIGEINARIAGYRKTSGDAPRVLITFGGDASSIDQIHAFGTECLHNELLEIAGGKNVVEGHLPFSTLSKEAAIRLNPDIIIQLAPGTEAPADPTKAWQGMAGINAVKNHRIHVLTGDHTCIPGPRFIQTLDDFAEIIRQND